MMIIKGSNDHGLRSWVLKNIPHSKLILINTMRPVILKMLKKKSFWICAMKKAQAID